MKVVKQGAESSYEEVDVPSRVQTTTIDIRNGESSKHGTTRQQNTNIPPDIPETLPLQGLSSPRYNECQLPHLAPITTCTLWSFYKTTKTPRIKMKCTKQIYAWLYTYRCLPEISECRMRDHSIQPSEYNVRRYCNRLCGSGRKCVPEPCLAW